MKSFHIWDFPDTIYVLIENKTKKIFLQEMYTYFGNRERYAKFLKLDPSTVREYDIGFSDKDGKKWIQYIPVRILKESKSFLTPKTIKLIEDNILAYRPRAGSPVKNPILPIKESPQLYRILGHIFGDGSATKKKVPYYANTCKELREEFIQDLQIFGEVKWSNRKLTVPIVNFQKGITQILAHIFEISFDKKDKLPERIFSTSNECKYALLRAIFDDEGSVSSAVIMCITEGGVAEGISTLLLQLDINNTITTFHKPSKKKVYMIRIKSKSDQKFSDLINFKHPKKADYLKARLRCKNRSQRYRSEAVFDKLILNFLNKKEKVRTKKIANHIELSLGHATNHLKRLEKEGKIKSEKTENKYFIWSKV